MIEVSRSWDAFRARFESQLGAHETIFMSPENAAFMFVLARAVRDTGDLFPRGKWAMIQHLEGTLEHHINSLLSEDSSGG